MTSITRLIANHMRALCVFFLMGLPVGAMALELSLPRNANLVRDFSTDPDSYALPVAPYQNGAIEVREIEGQVVRQVWRIDAPGVTTLQLLSPLREQLKAAGFDIAFECEADACGGFDFRFNTEVAAAPDMYVDLFDFRFLAASNAAKDDNVTLLVSRSTASGYVQIIRAAPSGQARIKTVRGDEASVPVVTVPTTDNSPELPLVEQLLKHGHVVLSDLTFKTGSSDLGDGDFASLTTLSAYLRANSESKIALVGHTDSVGSLDGNIALSKRRAASVLERLARQHDVSRAQLAAEGMGYLSPITNNLDDKGREENRRVEAILLDVE